jgi:hypothetical protein
MVVHFSLPFNNQRKDILKRSALPLPENTEMGVQCRAPLEFSFGICQVAAVSWCAGEIKHILQSLIFLVYSCHVEICAMIPPPRIKLSSEFPTAKLTFLVTSPQASNFPSFVIREKSDTLALMALMICFGTTNGP